MFNWSHPPLVPEELTVIVTVEVQVLLPLETVNSTSYEPALLNVIPVGFCVVEFDGVTPPRLFGSKSQLHELDEELEVP